MQWSPLWSLQHSWLHNLAIACLLMLIIRILIAYIRIHPHYMTEKDCQLNIHNALETSSQLSESIHGLCFTAHSLLQVLFLSAVYSYRFVQLLGASLSTIYHMYDTYIQSSNMSMTSCSPLDAAQCIHVLRTGAHLLCSPGLSP